MIKKQKLVGKLMSNKKFVTLFIFGVIVMLGSIAAFWVASFQGSTGFVVSNETSPLPITFSDTFEIDKPITSPQFAIDTSEFLYIENTQDFPVDYIVNYSIVISDVPGDGCNQREPFSGEVDHFGDWEVYVRRADRSIILPGEIFIVEPGLNTIEVQQVLLAYACPARYVLDLNLSAA